ncbi:MAG: hypothetical protein JWM10_3323 [Myxococcaceae bacterium]|nr:hypothetical protein [Myxococcaceae bacterium]
MSEPTPGFEAEAVAMGRRLFESSGEIGVRMCIVDCGPDRGKIFAAMPVEGLHDPTMLMFRDSLRRERAVGVAVISEVWQASVPEGGKRSDIPADLSTYAGRRELVLVLVEHRAIDGGATRHWEAPITRDVAGAPTLGPFALRAGESRGRMTRLLPFEGGARG